MRNIIFLSIACSWAEKINSLNIFIGANAIDYSGYPDCRNETIQALEKSINLGMEKEFKFHTPLMWKDKSEIWEIGKSLNILQEIIEAAPTDGLWDDGRTDEGQLGFKYEDLEDAMNNPNSPHRQEYEKIRKQNLHKMEPIPVCKIPS